MSLRPRTLKLLSALLPGGVLGLSVGLAANASAAPVVPPTPDHAPNHADVANRLQAIRDDVSATLAGQADVTGSQTDPNIVRVQWRNWPNWRNGGWRNGGWHNGGWRNWPNWHNGWNNWHNGWLNW